MSDPTCIYCGGHDYSGQGGPDGQLPREKCPICSMDAHDVVDRTISLIQCQKDKIDRQALLLRQSAAAIRSTTGIKTFLEIAINEELRRV